MRFKVLTIRQPWASLIILGKKNVENRTWSTNYRGQLVIHAGTAPNTALVEKYERLTGPDLPRGFILGTVDVVDVVVGSRSRWAEPGNFHWILRNPRPLPKPIPTLGRLGLWTPDPALARKLRRAVVVSSVGGAVGR